MLPSAGPGVTLAGANAAAATSAIAVPVGSIGAKYGVSLAPPHLEVQPGQVPSVVALDFADQQGLPLDATWELHLAVEEALRAAGKPWKGAAADAQTIVSAFQGAQGKQGNTFPLVVLEPAAGSTVWYTAKVPIQLANGRREALSACMWVDDAARAAWCGVISGQQKIEMELGAAMLKPGVHSVRVGVATSSDAHPRSNMHAAVFGVLAPGLEVAGLLQRRSPSAAGAAVEVAVKRLAANFPVRVCVVVDVPAPGGRLWSSVHCGGGVVTNGTAVVPVPAAIYKAPKLSVTGLLADEADQGVLVWSQPLLLQGPQQESGAGHAMLFSPCPGSPCPAALPWLGSLHSHAFHTVLGGEGAVHDGVTDALLKQVGRWTTENPEAPLLHGSYLQLGLLQPVPSQLMLHPRSGFVVQALARLYGWQGLAVDGAESSHESVQRYVSVWVAFVTARSP